MSSEAPPRAFPNIPVSFFGIPESTLGVGFLVAQMVTFGPSHHRVEVQHSTAVASILLALAVSYTNGFRLYNQGGLTASRWGEGLSIVINMFATVFGFFKFMGYIIHSHRFHSTAMEEGNVVIAIFIFLAGLVAPVLREKGY